MCRTEQLTLADWEDGFGQCKDRWQHHKEPDVHEERNIVGTPGKFSGVSALT